MTTEYFNRLAELLRARGCGRPTLVIDLERLDRNCARLHQTCRSSGKSLRIVAKSLPSPGLLKHVLAQTHTDRIMSFHQPFLSALTRLLPHADLLLGKPLPLRAAETFYRKHERGHSFDATRQLHWLIDSRERLAQYAQLARNLGTKLGVNIELDVGLHRGGLTSPDMLDSILTAISADPDHLSFRGFMGYDAHVGRLPAIVERRATSLQKATAIYADFVAYATHRFPDLVPARPIYNGAGSPTFRLHGADSPLNELSVGSALVKPCDFDLDLLHDFEPAAFIATPVLKVMDGLHMPGSELFGKLWAAWDSARSRTAFIYGGNWLAKYVSPPGLRENQIYGRSSNQEIVNFPKGTALHVDDYVFLRPTQSEAVLLQFGDLMAIRADEIEAYWPVLTPEHDQRLDAT